MKVKLPRSWFDLPQSERNRIEIALNEWALQRVDEEHVEVQKIYMKILCIVLYEKMGMTVDEILLVLANFRDVYRINSRMKTREEQQAWLDSKMDEIFGPGGYPTEYIDKLKEV